MNLLAIETSAKAASCAISCGGALAAEFFANTNLKHSETIMTMVKCTLRCSRLALSDIDAFSVSAGPGSFTGLRIGISAIKGMAEPLDKPCYAVSSLKGLAYNLLAFEGIVVPVMDARRGQVYTALFKSKNGSITRISEDSAISLEALYEKLKDFKEPISLVGDGAKLHFDFFSQKLNGLRLAPENLLHQRAGSVLLAAMESIENGVKPETCEALAPVYLRLSQAERERLAKSEEAAGSGPGNIPLP